MMRIQSFLLTLILMLCSSVSWGGEAIKVMTSLDDVFRCR